MTLVDYHLHSHVSHDGVGTLQEHVRRAEEIGLFEVCFTEHLDFYLSRDGISCSTIPSEEQLQRYLDEVRGVQRHAEVKVGAGVELDYKPECDHWVRDLVARFPFDFVLGSVHNVGPWSVSGPAETVRRFFQERGALEGCLDYYEVVERAVATGLFDSVAHLDLMKRFRPENRGLMSRGELRDRIVAILDLMVATSTGIEINTAGLFHAPREPYPSLDLLKLARDRGVAVLTVGSDSHRPETVGRRLDAALSLAKEAGFTYLYTFERRVARATPL